MLRSKSLGIDAWGRRVPLLLYADDIVLLASTPEELQQMLDVTSTYARSWQFRFNTKPGKSNVVVVPATSANLADAERAAFRMGDGPLHLSQEYKYLGVEMGKTRGCWNSFLSRVHMKKVHSVLYAVASGDRPLKLDTAIHLFEAYVRPSFEYACGLWGAMLSQAGLQTLESIQTEFARRVLRLGSTRVAHAYLRAELGLWPAELRVKQAGLSLFGQLCSLPVSRLAAHVFRRRCADVAAGGGQHSWCLAAQSTLRDAGFAEVWRTLQLPDGLKSWKAEVYGHCAAQYQDNTRTVVAQHSSLELFAKLGRLSGVEEWLASEVVHPGKLLKVKLRAGALPLMVHVGVANGISQRQWRRCVMCDSGAVETEEHFVLQCPYYDDLRAGCVERVCSLLHSATEQVDLLRLVAGDWSSSLPAEVRFKAERRGWDFLKLAWRRRELIWSQVCVERNPWRLLYAPR